MNFKLPITVASTQDLNALILELREYSYWSSHEAIKQKVEVKDTLNPPNLSPDTIKFIYEWKSVTPADHQNVGELIAALELCSTEAPSITFTLAAPPTVNVKRMLVSWCRDNISPDVLVSFQFNTTLLGGMVVRFGSRMFDWSFKRQILDARSNFPEVLRRV
jgi:hypothetical protein